MSKRTTAACIATLAVAVGFIALGLWQVERRAWKHALIERVTARVDAPASPAPTMTDWPGIGAEHDEYRHVRLTGTWLLGRSALVQAVTERGSGYWLLTPLRTADRGTVLVNRGFLLPEARDPATRRGCAPPGIVEVTGLLRITEPGGGFLRRNDPAADRWFSRDVAAIAAARRLDGVAPYFVDAAANPQAPPNCPVGGLTVIAFHDNHAVYALTWFALAAMCVAGAWQVIRAGRRGMMRA